MSLQFCIHCSSKIPSDSQFCPHCGMRQQLPLAEPEPPTNQFRETILRHVMRIRLGLFIISIVIFIIFFYWGSQTTISLEEATRLIDDLRAMIGPEPSILTIITNNVMISLLLFIPVVGVFFLAFISQNSGIVLAAISQIEGFNTIDVFISSLLYPWSWFEIVAYGLAASQGIMLLIALLTRRLQYELKWFVIMGILCVTLLSVGAIIEILAIG
jgi:hypothetical protein